MSVSNLTNTKWLWNSEVDVYTNRSYSINFTSNNTNYTSISVIYTHEVKENWGLNYNSTEVFFDYDNVDIRWIDEAYCTIEITGGTDVTNSALISWLEENATQQATSATIVLGTNTLTDVDTIKCIDGTDNTKYNEFKYGVTPSTTTSIKVGENTLTGVNNIKVSTNTSGYAEFGYVPSGFTITLSNSNYGLDKSYDSQHEYYLYFNGGTSEYWRCKAGYQSPYDENNNMILDGATRVVTSIRATNPSNYSELGWHYDTYTGTKISSTDTTLSSNVVVAYHTDGID